MSKAFDLRKQLKLHDGVLLRRLFEEHGVLPELPWGGLKPHATTIFEDGWESIAPDTKRQLEVVLQDVHELADERGQKVLIEDLQARCPGQLADFWACKSLLDKALWAYLEARAAFDDAAIFARAEALRGGQFANRWNSLPKRPITVTEEATSTLEASVRDFYRKKELRGDQCRVHHYTRPNGENVFYAYLPDWADKRLGFDPDGNLTPRELHYAFSNVFIFEPAHGALEIIAKGGKKVQFPLRRAFCKSILGIDVDDAEPLRSSYVLDHLLDPAFAFTTLAEDKVAAVRLRRVRLLMGDSTPVLEGTEWGLREDATLAETQEALERALAALGLNRRQVSVAQAGIQIEFQSDGRRKARTMTFNVGVPNTCDLKSKPEDVRVVGERCIRRWGVLRD